MNQDWNKLLDFESREQVQKLVKDRFNYSINAEKAHEINAQFIQGREYFKNALNADFSVKPLLQYYGILALSKGVVLFLNPEIRETQLKGSHGLEVTNWKDTLNNTDFGKLNIKVQNGSFMELLETTKNQNFLRANSSNINYESSLRYPYVGYSIKLEDLVQYFPDLETDFNSWCDKILTFRVIEFIETEADGNKVTIKMKTELTDDVFNLLFPQEFCPSRSYSNNIVTYEQSNWAPNLTQKWSGAFNIGDVCIVPVFSEDIGFNQLSGMFMISYVFGMLARYYPTTWLSIRRGGKGDRIYPFAQRLLRFIDEKYPRIVLDFLTYTSKKKGN